MRRRAFLQSIAAPAALLASRQSKAVTSPAYVVRAGHTSESYRAARTAIAVCGQFPSAAMAGKTVVIKPNLATDAPSTSGITTDPQGRITLVDLCKQTDTLAPVATDGGMVFDSIWLPKVVANPDIILIRSAKLKTHMSVGATLSMKNLVGIAPPSIYNADNPWPRQDPHYRGIAETIIDLNRARPIHFAVIDGIRGMQGQGRTQGTAVGRRSELCQHHSDSQ